MSDISVGDHDDLLATLLPSPTGHAGSQQPLKRKASQAGLDGATGPLPGRSVKRRASKACQCCRARKVRCNVTEHGAPCTNCRLDEVECVVSESRRKKKWNKDDEGQAESSSLLAVPSRGLASRSSNASASASASALDALQVRTSASRCSDDTTTNTTTTRRDQHVPHSIYQSQSRRLTLGSFPPVARHHLAAPATASTTAGFPISAHGSSDSDAHNPFFAASIAPAPLPYFIKPLPPRIGPDEAAYLELKGALTVPPPRLRNELLKAYIEFVHPFMPLLDLHDFVAVVDSGNGTLGRLSLILFQAVMFAGSAFCDFEVLRAAGYATRKEARKDFFTKTRLLYDFDYEQDRLSLVQAILLLTYYYETPDDQKDTWHWMGVATSVAHTIGLHRNPDKSNLTPNKAKLWKRIWWSLYMRDRLIALGMRRPTRVKEEDYDVPMLTMDDFDLRAIPDSVACVPLETLIARNVEHQRQMAVMCIEKTRLCLCITHVLSKQYCVMNNSQGAANDKTTMMLLPKKADQESTNEIRACDQELERWLDELPDEARYTEAMTGNPAVDLCRTLLHMVFFTTLSALHRPQVLPSEPTPGRAHDAASELLEDSRLKVRRAAASITSMAQSLDSHDLVRYLPTTGVTVLLPAIIIHLLDIKSPDDETRRGSLRGFCQCMAVVGKLRDIYAAADYSIAFLEAAIRKAGIQIAAPPAPAPAAQQQQQQPTASPEGLPVSPSSEGKPQHITSVKALVDAGRRMEKEHSASQSPHFDTPAGVIKIPRVMTPPPDQDAAAAADMDLMTEEEMHLRLQSFLAATPPDSDDHHSQSGSSAASHANEQPGLTQGFAAAAVGTAPVAPKTPKFAAITGMALDLTSDSLFPLFQSSSLQDFDDGDFNDLLNLDAMGEGFSFDDGLEAAVRLEDQGIGGGIGADWGF